jgi:hypothetical protein
MLSLLIELRQNCTQPSRLFVIPETGIDDESVGDFAEDSWRWARSTSRTRILGTFERHQKAGRHLSKNILSS